MSYPLPKIPFEPKSRIAPTPSGYLHIGNAFSFLLTYLAIKKLNGRLLLRIDDLDKSRVRDVYIEDIFFQLEWLGIEYDEGPTSISSFKKDFSQRHRLGMYHALMSRLLDSGIETYTCTCSRSDIQNMYGSAVYKGHCRHKKHSFGTKNSLWRVHPKTNEFYDFHEWNTALEGSVLSESMGDFVIRKRDGFPSYQICSLADDLYYKTNFIIRGKDLIPSTAAQVFLAQYMNLEEYADMLFLHHGLVLDDAATKMSKSHKSLSLNIFRENHSVQELYQLFAVFMRMEDHKGVRSLQDLLDRFQMLRIPRKDIEIQQLHEILQKE